MKTPERCQWRLSGVFFVNLEHISHLALVLLLLTLNMQLPADNNYLFLVNTDNYVLSRLLNVFNLTFKPEYIFYRGRL